MECICAELRLGKLKCPSDLAVACIQSTSFTHQTYAAFKQKPNFLLPADIANSSPLREFSSLCLLSLLVRAVTSRIRWHEQTEQKSLTAVCLPARSAARWQVHHSIWCCKEQNQLLDGYRAHGCRAWSRLGMLCPRAESLRWDSRLLCEKSTSSQRHGMFYTGPANAWCKLR